MNSPDNQGTAALARALVAKELASRGALEVGEVRDKNRRLLEFFGAEGGRGTVIVKCRRSGTWQASSNDGDLAKADKKTHWVFVDLQDVTRPAYHVMPDLWIRENIRRHHDAYLQRHGGHRAVSDDSTHHAIQPARIREWLGRWDLLGLSK